MATPYSDVFDHFMMLIKDYSLIELYSSSATNFTTYLTGWMVQAIRDFSICTQSLERNDVSQQFTQTLTEENQIIIAHLMIKYWLLKEVQDVVQMKWTLQDHDFKHYSEAQNLKSKMDYLNVVKEDISHELIEYGYKNNDWESWKNGIFDGS